MYLGIATVWKLRLGLWWNDEFKEVSILRSSGSTSTEKFSLLFVLTTLSSLREISKESLRGD